jgi:peptidoglycan hydrolase-like protein with peptidoglycan-binding domain
MKNLEEELLKQLRLMSYDRGKILSEQITDFGPQQKSDRLGTDGDFKPYKKDYTKPKTPSDSEKKEYDNNVANYVYNKIVNEISPKGSALQFWNWGTDENGLTYAIQQIKNKQQYQILRNLLAKKYPESASPNTLLQFLQEKEFSTAFYSAGMQDVLRDGPLGLGQEYQYQTNDKFLRLMKEHLQKFNPNEKYNINSIKVPAVSEKTIYNGTEEEYDKEKEDAIISSAISMLIPPAASEALHLALPAMSMALSVFPPAAVAVELIDAGLYYIEGDKYSAGLGLCFAFIPGGAFGMLARKLGNAGKKLLMKKVSQEAAGVAVTYTDDEIKALKSLSENSTEAALKAALSSKALGILIRSAATIIELFKIVYWLVKKGFLLPKFLITTGIEIGGVFYTWDYIASVLGLCNTMSLVQFSEAEEGHLKLIGGAAEFLQRFSDPCEQNRGAKYLKDELDKRKVTTKQRVILKLQNIVDNNYVLTNLNFANKKLLETMAVQVALRALGMDKFNYITLVAEPQQKTYVEKPYDPNDPWVKFMLLGNSEESVKKMWKIKQNQDKQEVSKSNLVRYDDPVTGKVFYFDSYEDYKSATKDKLNFGREVGAYGQVNYIQTTKTELFTANFNWGYYNEDTKKVVEEFQRKNNLSVDGEVGVNTAKKLIEKVNALGSVSGYGSGIDKLTAEEMIEIEKTVVEQIQKERENALSVEDLKQKPTAAQIQQSEEDFKKNKTNEFEKQDPNLFKPDIIFSEADILMSN